MIQTKLFEGHLEDTGEKYDNGQNKRNFISVDEEINRFLQINLNVEVIDIKFSVGGASEDIIPMALLVYKELR